MRLAFTAAAFALCLLLCALQPAVSQTSAGEASAPGNSSDAAEKHAKRTACLREAKAKKLIGAQKTAYLKDCIGSDGRKPLTTSTAPAAPG